MYTQRANWSAENMMFGNSKQSYTPAETHSVDPCVHPRWARPGGPEPEFPRSEIPQVLGEALKHVALFQTKLLILAGKGSWLNICVPVALQLHIFEGTHAFPNAYGPAMMRRIGKEKQLGNPTSALPRHSAGRFELSPKEACVHSLP